MSREAIAEALFVKVGTLPGLATKSRQLKHWNHVPKGEQPALYLTCGPEQPIRLPGGGNSSARSWAFKLYLYAHDASDAPAKKLNALLDALEIVLKGEPARDNRQTLGGLVWDVRFPGPTETDEGVLGEQGVATIPLEVIVTE